MSDLSRQTLKTQNRKSLRGQSAVITGAGSGIGYATAQALARRGVRVMLADIVESSVHTAAAAIIAEGGEAYGIRCDVSQGTAMESLRMTATAQLGQVDIVMNNVGVLVNGKPEDIPPAEWERVISINLMSVVRSIHSFVPAMIARRSGHIINTASFAGLFPYAWDRLPYAMTKGAIVTLTEGLALYLKPEGIGVTLLCPGPVNTNIGSTKRTFTPGIRLRGPGPQFAMKQPAEVGELVASAIEHNQFMVSTDSALFTVLEKRAANFEAFLDAQIAGMGETD
jgi:NAD(P)-dependent dehydrogenase (short-subunit alcohol dehydrogenase family)